MEYKYSFIDDHFYSGEIVVRQNPNNYLEARYQYYLQVIMKPRTYGEPIWTINNPSDINLKDIPGPCLIAWETERSLIYIILVEDDLGRWTQHQIYIQNDDIGKYYIKQILANYNFPENK